MPRRKATSHSEKTRKRYKNDAFLQLLGNHCRNLRRQRGYSIDRLAKESDQLSPATIDRLERGLADSQILVLLRYAETLGMTLLELFSFLKDQSLPVNDARIIPYETHVSIPKGFVPVYPIKVAAGLFSDANVTGDINPIGFVDAGIKGPGQDHFAAFVHGDSMKPLIQDNDLCLFKKYSGGSRQGKIFLIMGQGITNSETGESFVLKRYMRKTPPRQSEDDGPSQIHLISENSKYSPIILIGQHDEEIKTLAEFLRVLPELS